MSRFLQTLRDQILITDGAMGSYLFELTGRLSEPNHVYEAFPAERPELITEIYFQYLQAGAQCLKTDTFGANRSKLDRFGLGDRVADYNRAGVRVARAAARDFVQGTGSDAPMVIGSIGPLRDEHIADQPARELFHEQAYAQLDEGVDAILLETFTCLPQLVAAIEAVRSIDSHMAVVALISPRPLEKENEWEISPAACADALLKAGANVMGVNCCAPWDALSYIEELLRLPQVRDNGIMLSAMPNAGGLQRIDNRYMSNVNPEYMGKQTRILADMGVRLIGGCCEVHPPHLREMRNYLRSRLLDRHIEVREPIGSAATMTPAGPEEKRGNGRFSRKLFDGEFCVSVEMLPPRGTSADTLARKIDFVRELAACGLADAVDVTDGSRGIPLMPPGDFVQVSRCRLGWNGGSDDPLEFIPHFAARDLNMMGIQSRLTGYYLAGIHNVIFITGDPPKMSPTYPRSTAVFDTDSPAMIEFTQAYLNAGVDFGGQSLGKHADPRMHFTIGTGFEPEALNMEREMEKLRRKIDHGADYILTQPAFRFDMLDSLEPFRDKSRILIGVMILRSLEHARRVGDVPGVIIPDSVLERLGRYDKPSDQAKVAEAFAAEQIAWVKREGWAGLYLMSPASHGCIVDVLRTGLT